jgi:cell division initiation protein
MKLTPLDIRHKEFKRGMRGYADVEVDEFLDEVADEYERLFKENIDSKELVETLEERLSGYKRLEETLQKTLITAQSSAEELKQNATKEAQLILHEAELKARQMVNEAYSEKQAIEQSMAKVKAAEQDCRFKFRQMLEGHLQGLDDAPQPSGGAVEDAGRHDMARHAEAIKEAIAREMPLAPRVATVPVASVAPMTAEPPLTDQAANASSPEQPETAAGSIASEPPAPPEPVAPTEPGPGAGERTASKERILFGESDDLLADVDSGVNENEFKW